MLIDPNGKIVQVGHNVRGHSVKGEPNWHAIAVLAPLRELHVPSTNKCGDMFKLSTRARMVQ